MVRQASFTVTGADATLIRAIVDRARDLGFVGEPKYPILSTLMDLTACHANGCPLDLLELLGADAVDLGHDVLGISTHINRDTGKIENHFVPRYAAPRISRRSERS